MSQAKVRITEALQLRAMATTVSLGMIPTGVMALALGEGSSRAFTIIPGGSLIAHLFGALLALGGALVLLAILRSETFIEVVGLACIASGAALYAGGVYIGLGANGLIAGTLSGFIALGAFNRVTFLTRLARSADTANQRGG